AFAPRRRDRRRLRRRRRALVRGAARASRHVESGATAWSIALAVDLVLGEPPASIHPVVGMGRAIAGLERVAPADPRRARAFGVLLPLVPGTAAALAGVGIGRLRPWPVRALAMAWALKTSFALRGLLGAGRRV